jgi:hypothetical protein
VTALPAHGTYARYQRPCRCLACRYARADYMREYNRTGGIRRVSAAPVRRHLLALAECGMEMQAVALLAGVAATQVYRVKNGRLKRVRRETRERLLSVEFTDYSKNTLVPSSHACKIIAGLRSRGVQTQEIAEALGYKYGNLHFGSQMWVTRRTMARLRLASLGFQRAGRVPGDLLEQVGS